MKKIISVVIALAMICSLGMMAFAVETTPATYTITIDNGVAGYSYNAYQVFAGTLSADGTTLSDITWGNGVNSEALLAELKAEGNPFENAFAACTTAREVAEVLDGKANDSEFAVNFANVVGHKLSGSGTDAVYNEDENYTISGLNAGYYIVVNDTIPEGKDLANSRFILKVIKDETVTPKVEHPTPEKKILEGENKKDLNEASMGETVTYELSAKVPDMTGYNEYYFIFNDTLSAGLTFTGNMTLTIDGATKTIVERESDSAAADAYYYTSTDEETGVTTIKVVLKDFIQYKALQGKDIVVTYTAVLNDKALIVDEANPNEVTIIYSNNPNHVYDGTKDEPDTNDPVGESEKDEVETYTTALEIQKTDDNNNPLKGAGFTLSSTETSYYVVTTSTHFTGATGEEADGTQYYWLLTNGTYTTTNPEETYETPLNLTLYADYVDGATEQSYTKYVKETVSSTKVDETEDNNKVFAMVGDDGIVRFSGLGAGQYTLEETIVPDGFNKCPDIHFTIAFNETTKEFEITNSDATITAENHIFYTTIKNLSGTVLPSTGGIGTTIFYTLGGILLIGAAVLLVAKKKMAYVA